MTLATHLVGRASELDSVDGLLNQIEAGHSAALELVGEPGIGKTRLLAELAARADARAYLVLSGRAGELERDLPFWVSIGISGIPGIANSPNGIPTTSGVTPRGKRASSHRHVG
jgi:predicted ATPase